MRVKTGVVAMLLLAGLIRPREAVGGEKTRALALEDYYQLVSVESPAISPDGKWVAFVKTTIVEAENRRQHELWLATTNGNTAPRKLSDPALDASGPRWSTDGQLLAFSGRARDGKEHDEGDSIWFLRMDQANAEAMQISGVRGLPIFSPDNQWIAFVARVAKPRAAQYASQSERLINERFKGRAYEWMNSRYDGRGYLPDPRNIEATPAEELFVVRRTGGEARQLTQLGVRVREAAWSPSSDALTFSANTHERDEYTYERADIFIATLAGQTKRLTDDGYNNDAPAWSPDGGTIAFRRELGLSEVIKAKWNHGAPVDINTMPASGGSPVNATSHWDLLPGAPSWSADGKFLCFSAGIGGNEHLFRVAAVGGDVIQVTHGERQLSGFSASASAGLMVYAGQDSAHPGELFVSSLDGRREKQLTSFNEVLLSEVALSKADRILYPSKDGTQIEGWVLKPSGYDSARSWPLILAIHGGPHGAYGNEFSFEEQLFAAQGYLVVYTNPRGSTNYGEEFLWATWGGWGNLDYEDVMAGVDYVRSHHHVDDKRLGVTGYSYGGFLTNWIIGHTTRFAAAIVGAGISNWISDYGTADIPRTKESEFFGPPWDAQAHALLVRQSPIEYAGNVTTPTLFVHGESDMRVPIEEGEQMYTALRKRRVPARFVRYPESYHVGWSPWNTVHRYYEELDWWRNYLDGEKKAGAPAS
jgi:dipeptidyl aminopeptidase/acylaminoacyl peptidase